MTPIAVFMIYPALRNFDGSLEEACWTSGIPRWQAVRHVLFPLVAPAIAAACLFFFILAIEVFDVVALVGLPGKIVVLSGMIYDATHPTYGLPNYGKAGVLGVILFVIAGIAIAFYLKLLVQAQRYQVVGSKIRHVQQELSRKGKVLADGFLGLWVMLSFVIPLLTLFWTSLVPYLQPPSLAALDNLSFKSYTVAISYLLEPLKNTLFVMVTSVILAVVLSICVSWVVTRSRNRWAHLLEFVVFLSIAVPSMVSAVAFQFIALKLYDIIPLYGSIVLVVLVLASRMLSFTTRTINGTALQLNEELDEAAYTSGLSRLTAFHKVFLPLVTPAVVYSAFVVAVLAARDLTVPLMVNTGSKELVSTLIYHLQSNGSYDVASAVGFYLMIFLLVLVLIARRLTGLRHW
jgi:iron(III) transport system permease protein